MVEPTVITANALLVWLVHGFMFGVGFALAWNLVGIPVRRYWP